MKTYKKQDGTLFAFEEDGSQDHLVTIDMQLLTDDELAVLLSPSKESRITVLQNAYEIELDALNKAWLSALISDGIGEATRQAAIKAQMVALSEQLDEAILAIIMEE